jgi:hypothetical protein
MKSGISHLIFFLSLIFLAGAGNAYAQEAGMSDVDIVGERETAGNEKLIFSPGEPRYVPKATAAASGKDSLALNIHDFPMQQAALKTASEKSDEKQTQKQKDDSILTFNFLYYIIQKYKLQDIID